MKYNTTLSMERAEQSTSGSFLIDYISIIKYLVVITLPPPNIQNTK